MSERGRSTAYGVPDWATYARTVKCPMCDYNLRGLVEPRCPECGHCFAWSQVTRGHGGRHPYLFEHAAHRPVTAFFRTILAQWNPEAFWTTLRPTHRVNGGRLMLYSEACAAFAMLPVLTLLVVSGSDWDKEARILVDSLVPFPMAFDGIVLQTSLFLALMPLVSGLTLQVFQASMRSARVLPVHAWRCGAYAGDVVVWAAVWQAVVVLICGKAPTKSEMDWAMTLLLLGVGFALLVNGWRLCVAYRKYMRFPDALSTVVASELVLALMYLAVVLRYVATAWLT